jgi:hypothetical protein
MPLIDPVAAAIVPLPIESQCDGVWCWTDQKLAPLYPNGEAGSGSLRSRSNQRVISSGGSGSELLGL